MTKHKEDQEIKQTISLKEYIEEDDDKLDMIFDLAFDYKNTSLDIFNKLKDIGEEIDFHELEKLIKFYRLDEYLKSVERWAKDGVITYLTFNEIAKKYKEYYEDRKYEAITKHYDELVETLDVDFF